MFGGAAGLQLHGKGTVPIFRASELSSGAVLLWCAENQPKGSSSSWQGVLEGEKLQRILEACVPSSVRLFWGDLSHCSSELGEGGNVLIGVRASSSLGRGCQVFRVWLRSLWSSGASVGSDSLAERTARTQELVLVFWFFLGFFKNLFLNFGCASWQIAGEERPWILPLRVAAVTSSSPVQWLGSACWCWACFKSPAF